MRIGILGGTGSLGYGLAVRLCASGYDVIIGSRDPARAQAAAQRLRLHNATGAGNIDACRQSDLVVLSVPLEGHGEFVRTIARDLAGRIVVDATVSMGAGRAFVPPPAGSAAAETQALVPDARVVAAFHTVSARLLADTSRALDQDVLVCGNDAAARAQVIELANAIGARGVDAGGLAAAAVIEALAVLIVELNVRYRRRDLGIRVAHLPDGARPR
jgi:NADPH-dependent F420 reductase